MNRVESMLGLATRAGRTASGLFLTENAIRSGKARLVLIAEDAETNTRKTLQNKCSSYRVPLYCYGTKERLGAAMGKEYRACAAITDAGFADSIRKLLEQQERTAAPQ